MAEHVAPVGVRLLGGGGLLGGLPGSGVVPVEHDCVHAEERPLVLGVGEEPLALGCGGHDVGDFGAFFGQVRCEVHFFPTISLFDGNTGEAELGADGVALDEVDETVCVTTGLLSGLE